MGSRSSRGVLGCAACCAVLSRIPMFTVWLECVVLMRHVEKGRQLWWLPTTQQLVGVREALVEFTLGLAGLGEAFGVCPLVTVVVAIQGCHKKALPGCSAATWHHSRRLTSWSMQCCAHRVNREPSMGQNSSVTAWPPLAPQHPEKQQEPTLLVRHTEIAQRALSAGESRTSQLHSAAATQCGQHPEPSSVGY